MLKTILIAASFSLATVAMADGNQGLLLKPFISVFGGYSTYHLQATNSGINPTRNEGAAWGFAAGLLYPIWKLQMGPEISYVKYPGYHYSNIPTANTSFNYDGYYIDFSALARLPIGNFFALDANIGIANVDQITSGSFNIPKTVANEQTNLDPVVGVGIDFSVLHYFTLGLMVNRTIGKTPAKLNSGGTIEQINQVASVTTYMATGSYFFNLA